MGAAAARDLAEPMAQRGGIHLVRVEAPQFVGEALGVVAMWQRDRAVGLTGLAQGGDVAVLSDESMFPLHG